MSGIAEMNKSETFKKDCKMVLVVTISALIYSFGYKVFVVNGNLYPGGFSGLSTLIVRLLDKYADIQVSFGLLYLLLNLGPTFLVFKHVGKRFAAYSILHYALVSLFSVLIPTFEITREMILLIAFGGFINGFSISLALRVGASSGGTDFVSIYLSTRSNQPSWGITFGINAIILTIAGFCFGWESALYSIIFQFISTQVVSHYHTRYKYDTLYIITTKPEQITDEIFHIVDHGVTKFWGEGGYSKKPKCLLLVTVNQFEVDEVIHAVQKTDSKAFITLAKTEKIVGNYVQRKYD